MPRGLGDVLHYFEPALETRGGRADPQRPLAIPAPPALAVPMAEGDVVRAALAWNLAVELARRGVRARLLGPAGPALACLAPSSAPPPLGAEVAALPHGDGEALARAALAPPAGDAPAQGALTLACVPREGLEGALRAGVGWVLLLVPPERSALREAAAAAERALAVQPEASVGVTVHGVRSVAEAESAFLRVAGAVEERLGRGVRSYGLLVDDLAVYRAIVERRPVGLAHPQSPAARALADVARLLHADLGGSAA